MKLLKNIFYLSFITLIVMSCNTPERSVGMNSWEGLDELKWHIGTEPPINTVLEFEDAWRANDYEKMKMMTTDSTTFTGGNGETLGVSEWFENIKANAKRRDSVGATLNWKTNSVFSVDIAPGEGGELVHYNIDVEYTEGDETSEYNSMQIWYIVDGKVIRQNSYWKAIVNDDKDEETDEVSEEE